MARATQEIQFTAGMARALDAVVGIGWSAGTSIVLMRSASSTSQRPPKEPTCRSPPAETHRDPGGVSPRHLYRVRQELPEGDSFHNRGTFGKPVGPAAYSHRIARSETYRCERPMFNPM